jgi:hypothetical protein
MEPKGIEDHDTPEEEDGVHGPVFQEPVLFDVVDIPDRDLPHHNAPIPFPIRMRGTAIVKANAPMTPSIEKVASMTSR